MSFDNDRGGQGGFRRQMVTGQWKCSNCGTEITQLPFEPDGQRPVYCRDCHAQRRAERGR